MSTLLISVNERYPMIETKNEILAEVKGLLRYAKVIAKNTEAIQRLNWSKELRRVANEICEVAIPQVGDGYLYSSFFAIFDSFLRNILTEEQVLHYLMIQPEEMSWFERRHQYVGKRVFDNELTEKKRVALYLVNRSKHHNPVSGFLDWNSDTSLDALEAEKFLAYQGF